jgi:signal transduction histidine kinase
VSLAGVCGSVRGPFPDPCLGIPVELHLATDTRLPEPIEVAASLRRLRALANATKHSQASLIEVSLAGRNGNLLVSIRDDGIGGADPLRGSGLIGLTDRVQALGGSIRVESRPEEGTHLTAELPLELDVMEESTPDLAASGRLRAHPVPDVGRTSTSMAAM